jgi:hypothetical protein
VEVAELAPADRETFLEQRRRLGVAATTEEGGGEGVGRAQGVRVLGTEHPPPDLEGPAVQGLDLVDPALAEVEVGKVVDRRQRVGVLLAESRDPRIEHLLQQGLRLGEEPEPEVQDPEIRRSGHGFPGVGGGPAEQRRHTFQVLPSVLVAPERDVGVADGAANGRLDLGLPGELLARRDPRRGLLEDVGHRHLLALGLLRVDRRQQLGQEVRHRHRPRRLELGLGACSLGSAAQDPLADETGDHECDQRPGDEHAAAVAAQKQAGAIAEGAATSAHRQTVEMTLEVLTELLRRRVACLRIGPKRHQADGVEIVGDASQRSWPSDADLGLGGLGTTRSQSRARGRRQLTAAVASVRPFAGEQLIQHDAEGVDIGCGGDRPALKLLGSGIPGCHELLAGPGQTGIVRRVGKQLRDAEVEELHPAIAIDQDIARFEVAVDHQVTVQVADRVDDLEHQAEDPLDRQCPRSNVVGDRLALDELHDEVGSALVGDPTVDEMGDVGVGKTRQ